MTVVSTGSSDPKKGGISSVIVRNAAMGMFVAVLAWSPFPLGGAISWGAGLQSILIALCWIFWAISTPTYPNEIWAKLRPVIVPLMLALGTLLWACVQISHIVPASWAHPLWAMTSQILGTTLPATISIDPWRTEASLMELASAVMACWLAYAMGRESKTASVMLNAVIFIGAGYALYAFVLAFMGTDQASLFYAVPVAGSIVSGPFMLHNSFATYCGLALMAATAELFSAGSRSIVTSRGLRPMALTMVQFSLGRGAILIAAMLLTLGGVVASASRAGFVSTMCGLAALGLVSLMVVRRRATRRWTWLGVLAAILPLLFLVVLNGDTLSDRLSHLFDSGITDNVRYALREATLRMIGDAPWLGLGLGTFQDAYPLYATRVLPYVMDKAHCDYLEFAAGIGLPAAIAWWAALAWLAALCVRGIRNRRRYRLYPITAVGATVLVAVHSTVDFSLQMPAVALLYAVLLGLGVSQAFPASSRAGHDKTVEFK